MVSTSTNLFLYADIYALCNFYKSTDDIEFELEKIDKNSSDAKSRWAIRITEPNNRISNYYVNNLKIKEVEENFEFKYENNKL